MSKKVFLSVGDISAANYLYEIFKDGFEEIELVGITNKKLESIGVKSVAKISDISVVGIVEVLPKFFEIKKIFERVLAEVRKCDILVACDAPGFNLRLIKKARTSGVKRIIYFISPQVWAWKPRRAETVARFSDDIIVILPFEQDIYKRFGDLKVHYVGHPLVDMVKPSMTEKEFFEKLSLNSRPVNLMPGSRLGEIKRHVGFLKKVIDSMLSEVKLEFVLPTFPEFKDLIENEFAGYPVKIITSEEIFHPAYNSMFYSRFSLIASGTSSLEAALALNPHIVFYKVNPLTFLLGKLLVKVPYVALPNILLKREAIPEMLNRGPEEVALRALSLLRDERALNEIKGDFSSLRDLLGKENVIPKLRQLFEDLIRSS